MANVRKGAVDSAGGSNKASVQADSGDPGEPQTPGGAGSNEETAVEVSTLAGAGRSVPLTPAGTKAGRSAKGEKPVAYISRTGADRAWLVSSGPRLNSQGIQIGWDPGVLLVFEDGNVTSPFYPESNPAHKQLVERIDSIIEENWPIVHDLGLEKMKPEAPRPPLKKWDRLSASAIKVALAADFGDNHNDNVRRVQEGIVYEQNRDEEHGGPRKDVMAALQGLLATEASDSSQFDVEVSLSGK